jgi:hypothetical protein
MLTSVLVLLKATDVFGLNSTILRYASGMTRQTVAYLSEADSIEMAVLTVSEFSHTDLDKARSLAVSVMGFALIVYDVRILHSVGVASVEHDSVRWAEKFVSELRERFMFDFAAAVYHDMKEHTEGTIFEGLADRAEEVLFPNAVIDATSNTLFHTAEYIADFIAGDIQLVEEGGHVLSESDLKLLAEALAGTLHQFASRFFHVTVDALALAEEWFAMFLTLSPIAQTR